MGCRPPARRGCDGPDRRPTDQSPNRESNPRPFPYHGNALPTELLGHGRRREHVTRTPSGRPVVRRRDYTVGGADTKSTSPCGVSPAGPSPIVATAIVPGLVPGLVKGVERLLRRCLLLHRSPAVGAPRSRSRMPGRPVPRPRSGARSAGRSSPRGPSSPRSPTAPPTWFPCNDHPSTKATYRITFESDSPYDVVATGTLVETRVRGSRTRRVFEQHVPMATYLASVHVGRYVRRALVGTNVPIAVVLPAIHERNVMHDLARLPEMTRLFGPLRALSLRRLHRRRHGRRPRDPAGGAGLATFGPNWLDGRGAHQRLVAHELAHQWFGNSLTVTTWADIWLNEGFACYAEWLWSSSLGGPTADALASQHRTRLARPRPGLRRSPTRARTDVRRPRLQAGRPHPARPAAAPRRRRPSSRCCATGCRATGTGR